jgi:hypothetical protein
MKFRDRACLEHVSPEFTNIFLSRDIRSVSELRGHRLYNLFTPRTVRLHEKPRLYNCLSVRRDVAESGCV